MLSQVNARLQRGGVVTLKAVHMCVRTCVSVSVRACVCVGESRLAVTCHLVVNTLHYIDATYLQEAEKKAKYVCVCVCVYVCVFSFVCVCFYS